MTDALKRAACAAIDAQAQRLTAFGRDILAHPELGYKETRTAGKVLEAFASLGLTDVTVLSKRAEEVARMPAHREAYDIAIARAVAPAATLAEYLLPLVKVGGRCLMQKGTRGPLEILEAGKIIDLCGGEITELLRLNFDGIEGEGNLIIIEKLRHTPKEFPRAVGTPAKKPILTSDDEKYREVFKNLFDE